MRLYRVEYITLRDWSKRVDHTEELAAHDPDEVCYLLHLRMAGDYLYINRIREVAAKA